MSTTVDLSELLVKEARTADGDGGVADDIAPSRIAQWIVDARTYTDLTDSTDTPLSESQQGPTVVWRLAGLLS